MASAPTGARTGLLRREREGRWVAGVCAGIARRWGIDPALVRLGFVVTAAAGGLGVALYALGCLAIPAGETAGPVRRRAPTGRAAVEVALGAALLLLSALLAVRGLGLWFSDAVTWPLVLVAGGGALIWRQSQVPSEPAAPPSPAPPAAERMERRAASVSRTGLGIALVVAAGVAFLHATGALGAVRDVLLAVVAAIVVLGVILAPWIARLARSLAQERAQRIRSQERAEMAAHLHDSVLQTLALVQRRADDPQEVATLARRQERELRTWLAGRAATRSRDGLAGALEAAAEEVERAHRVVVEVVVVGDRRLDPAAEAVVAAAREAMVNAAKFGGGSPIDVYAEAEEGRLQLFVRDRGPGFDPGAIPPDRRGVRESIVGRMRRHGGRATVTSAPGGGTEVELLLEDAAR